MSDRRYRTIVADPPWPLRWSGGAGELHRNATPMVYSTMSLEVHSAKPDGALDLVELVSPGPYVELFARRARFGWDYWGDESLGTVMLPGVVA